MKRPGNPSLPNSSYSPDALSKQQSVVMQLHQLQKMKVFGALVGGVAHDFNNLLSIFHGYTEILQMEITPGNPLQEYLSEMISAVERAKTLTSQLLNFSRSTESAPRALRLTNLLLDFRRMMGRLISENIELVTILDEDVSWVLADPRQIETLLTNLVVNACEAMPRGGRLSIELKDALITPASRKAKAGLKPGAYVRIAISDNGIGMEKDLLPHIFDSGFTTKQTGSNNGLGLFLCAGIVAQSGGKIFAESTPGKGSTFTVFLPRIEAPSREEPAKTRKTSSMGKGPTILVVEDDPPVQKILAAMVTRLGFQALCAANGDEALKILEDESKIRLVIADIIMPLMGGIQLAEIVRRRWPEKKMILISGHAFEPPTAPCIDNVLFLPQPITSGTLNNNLRKLLNV